MSTPISVSPFKCRVWSLHERLDTEINEETCKDEIESFLQRGQLIAVLSRRLHGEPDHEIELICGARRLFVARHLNRPLLVEVREFTDREGIVAMDAENRQRKDVSPYERGLAYAQWLRAGQFESREEIARVLNLSASQICRLLRLARLPAVIVGAFRSPVDITESWGLELMDALKDEQRREATIRTARTLARRAPRLPGREVFRRLLGAVAYDPRCKHREHDKVVLGGDGSPLFRMRYQNSSIALIVPTGALSRALIEQIESRLAALLQGMDESAQAGVVSNAGKQQRRPAQPAALEKQLSLAGTMHIPERDARPAKTRSGTSA